MGILWRNGYLPPKYNRTHLSIAAHGPSSAMLLARPAPITFSRFALADQHVNIKALMVLSLMCYIPTQFNTISIVEKLE